VVYKARRVTGEVVAIKTLQRLSPADLYRFKQEFRVVAGLNHPNLAKLYELISDGDHWFFSMEYLEGQNFLTHIQRRLRTESEWRAVFGALATGIEALHVAGVVHRDIKPSNVLVTAEGRVVLLDFGLASELNWSGESGSTPGVIAGTVPYMAPEQAAGDTVTPAVDWYAFGVMMYQVLAGRLPFTGPTHEVLFAKRHWDPLPPSQYLSDVPADWDQLCRDLLSRDPARRPKGADVLRRLGQVVPEFDPSRVRLFGRDEQLAELGRAFDGVRHGRTVCVRIHGPSGSGKSALARQFLNQVSTDGAVVLRGRCYEQELVPYKAFDAIIDALSRYLSKLSEVEATSILPREAWALARIFPVLNRVSAFLTTPRPAVDVPDQREVRRRGTAALRELFTRLGDRQQVVIQIDDFQWSDVDSGGLLDELLRLPDTPRMMVLLCYRDEDAGIVALQVATRLSSMAPNRDVIDIPLRELANDDAQALVADRLGRRDERVERIVQEAGGNPFFLGELVEAEREGVSISGVVSLDQVLWKRVLVQSDGARRFLEVVSVAGRPIREAVVRKVVGGEADFPLALGGLRAGRLLRVTGDDLIAPYHDRVREAVLANLTPEVRRAHHQRIANALVTSNEPDAEFLAIHFQGGGELQVAAGYYAQAAEEASHTTAFDHAARLYRLANDLSEWPSEEKARLKAGEAGALVHAGRGKAAAEAYLVAAGLVGREQAIEWKRKSAEQYIYSGHLDAGVRVLKAVLTAVGMTYPESKFRLLCGLIVGKFQLRLRGIKFWPRPIADIPPEDLLKVDVCSSSASGFGVTTSSAVLISKRAASCSRCESGSRRGSRKR
jgi:hypothetical protein